MIAILSVSLNDESRLAKFLENKTSWNCQDYRYYLIDNGSQDHTIQIFEAADHVHQIIRMPQNQGTVGGYNAGLRAALADGADYIMFLAIDILLAPDCLTRLTSVMAAQTNLGVLAPILFHSHQPDTIETLGATIDAKNWSITHLYKGQKASPGLPPLQEADYVDGGTSFFRASALKRVGFLDEKLFMYGEDLDICLRLRQSGYRVAATSQAQAWHRHLELNKGVGYTQPYQVYYLSRNRVYLMQKHRALGQPGAYWRVLSRIGIWQTAYYLIRQRNPRLARICLEAIVHGVNGKMGKTKYVR